MAVTIDRYNQNSFFGAQTMIDYLPAIGGHVMTCKESIFPKIKEEDFLDMYKDGGRDPISPKLLMAITVLQYLEKLPDRQTIDNLIYRIDWKVALELELDYEGFTHQTLSVFRQRLVKNDKAKDVFDKIIEGLKAAGLIKKNSKQRIDSTHVLAEIKELTRVELMIETLRLAVLDLQKVEAEYPEFINQIIETYEFEIKLYHVSPIEREKILKKAGQDMLKMVEFIKTKIPSEMITKNLQTLKTVFEQNFTYNSETKEAELIKVATGKDHICSPHDTEARFGSKHKNIGYKAQIVETAEREMTNFIIDIKEEDNQETDSGKLEEALERLEEKDLKPTVMYADQGYVNGEALKEGDKKGVKIMGPVANAEEGLNSEFKYNNEKDEYTCPAGYSNISKREEKDGSTIYRFSNKDCKNCNLKKECRSIKKQESKDGRILRISSNNEYLQQQRKLMKTTYFKEEMKNRNAIEGTISAMKRGYNFCRCRYKGKLKFRFQMILTAISFNIRRLAFANATI